MYEKLFVVIARFSWKVLGKLGVLKNQKIKWAWKKTYQALAPSAPTLVELDDFKLYVRPRDTAVGRELLLFRSYEKLLTQLVRELIKPGSVVIDVGANIGYFTLLFSKLVGPSGKVFSFEPDPTTFSLLKKNVEVNNLTNVTLFNKAVSDKDGQVSFYVDEGSPAFNSIAKENVLGNAKKIDVPCVTLDAVFQNERVDFLKVDTQGFEPQVFSGARELLTRSDFIALTEFWPIGYQQIQVPPKAYLEMLQGLGSRVFSLEDKSFVATPSEQEALIETCFSERGSSGLRTILVFSEGRKQDLSKLTSNEN